LPNRRGRKPRLRSPFQLEALLSFSTRRRRPTMNTAIPLPPARAATRVCLVTEELAGVGSSGGIGAAFLELAQLLAGQGMLVDVLYCPIPGSVAQAERPALAADFASRGIKLGFLDAAQWVTEPLSYEKRSYAIARHLSELERSYDFVHFHDYKGLAYFATSLKRQGLGLADTRLVVQLHGPTRWTIDANQSFFVHEDQLKIDFMERMSIAQADRVVSPSAYLVQWLREEGFELPADTRVIKNVCSQLGESLQRLRARRRPAMLTSGVAATDLVFFARHEDRKGFAVFCEALQLMRDELAQANVTVTFLGKFGAVDSQPSGVYLIDNGKDWRFPIRVRSGLARDEAVQYILSRPAPVVVIPSPAENSPYTVLESIMLGVPVISSVAGGGPELFADRDYPGLCEITGPELAARMRMAIGTGIPVPAPAETSAEIDSRWLTFHGQTPLVQRSATNPPRRPQVTFAITHHERPKKLVDAILSAVCQTYSNVEILVVDDGSSSEAAVEAMAQVEHLLKRVGGRLVRRQNGYLGAARNTAVREAKGEYICFLDDDDIATPELVQTLVIAIESTGADAVNCMNIFMEESDRSEVLARSDKAPKKVSYVPLGGPLALAPTENCIGAATAIFRKSSLLEIGGYSELRGVGHEDYELYLRLVQAGKKVQVVPLPLYFYEVGRPSMLSRTSIARNFRRCFDVVDTRQNSEAWRDLVALNVGKSVVVNAHNRQWWLYSLCKTAELRHRILEGGMDRVTTLRSLIELAASEGRARLHAAFADDLAQGHTAPIGSELDEAIALDTVLADGSAVLALRNILDPAVLGLRLDLALGRHEDAVRLLAQHLLKSHRVDEAVLQLVQQLVNDTGAASLPADAWKALGAALRGGRAAKALLPELATTALKIFLLAHERAPAQALLAQALKAAEADYLHQNPDVAEQVRAAEFGSALEHYLGFGRREGRCGFALLRELEALAHRHPALHEIFDELVSAVCMPAEAAIAGGSIA
jgi:glycosyltransferase involved in cell wall biosynthesis